jgi:tRNA threonylcarbamoyladenosine biosynthesis protein TsaE
MSNVILQAQGVTKRFGNLVAVNNVDFTINEFEVVGILGSNGAGKTTFVRGLVRGLGVTGDITSPTFALLNVYEGHRQIFHVDAYRLTQPEAFDDLLIWDLAKSPWNVVVEWPEKVAERLPSARWQMKTAILADGGHRFQLTLAG